MPKLHIIEAQVHKQLDLGYRVKVSILDLGMYINGCRVFPPNGEHTSWTVYPPQQNVYGKYIDVLEFNKKLSLWLEIQEACIEVVKQYMTEVRDVVLTDIQDGPINFDGVPF